LPFYNHFLERIRTCQDTEELFDCLFAMLHWKLGNVQKGTGSETSPIVDIDGISYTWSDVGGDFWKRRTDTDFLNHCLRFRDGKISGCEFFEYLKDRRVFGSRLVLNAFMIHLLRPEEHPMIDQHVWRAMHVLKGLLESTDDEPTLWEDYKEYESFFNEAMESMNGPSHTRFERNAVDRAFMAFGKWIKAKK